MENKTYKIYATTTLDNNPLRIIDLSDLTKEQQNKVKFFYEPHDYPTVYMNNGYIDEKNGLFLKQKSIKMDLNTYSEYPVPE